MTENTFTVTGKKTILTAGAGSGKTTALSAAVIEVLRNNPDISFGDILLITFTNKAVEEMKVKIFQIIEEIDDEDFKRRLYHSFNQNSIYTFDAFFSSILREYGLLIGLDPGFTILDEQGQYESNNRKKTIFRQLLRDLLRGDGIISPEETNSLLTAFKKSGNLFRFVDELIANRDRNIEFIDLLNSRDKDYIWEAVLSRWIEPALQALSREVIGNFKSLIKTVEFWAGYSFDSSPSPKAREWFVTLLGLLEEQASWKDMAIFLLQVNLSKSRSKKIPPEFNADIEVFQDIRKKISGHPLKKIFILYLSGEEPPLLARELELLSGSALIAREMRKKLEREKYLSSVLEFDDILYYTGKLLEENEWIGKKISSKYPYLFIDEFQDTSPSQLKVIQRIFNFKTANLLFVGDVKQSIYRFRNAEVRLIGQVKQKLEQDSQGTGAFQSIPLQRNYRSHPDLVKLFNYLFREIFRTRSPREDYRAQYGKDEEQLSPEKIFQILKYTGIAEGKEQSYCRYVEYEKADSVYTHISVIVENILRREESKVFLRGKQGYPLVGILLPTTAKFSLLEKLLKEKNISHSVVAKGYYQLPEIVALKNLLRFFLRPRNLFAVTALLRSALLGLGEKEILNLIPVIEREGWNSLAISGELEQWIAWQRSLPLKEVIWKVVLSSPLGLKLIDETGDNSSVWLNINRFIEELPDAPLGDIVEMLEENEKENVDKTVGESSSEVVIMTVHKSKGLKFQHVITVIPRPAGKNKQGFRWAQLSVKGKNRYLTVPSLTLTDDPSAGDRNKSELKTVVDYQSGLEETEEEKRLFYVALTRAVQGVTIYNSGNKNTLPEGGLPDRNLHVSKTVSQLFNRIENMGKEAEREAGISHNGFFVFEKLEPDKKDAGNVSQYSDPVKEKLFFPLLRENNRFIIKLNPSRISEFFSEEKNSGRGKFSRDDYDPAGLGTSFHEFMEQNIRSLLAGEKNFSEDIPDEIALHVANTVELLSPFSSGASVYPEAYFSAAEEIKVKDKNVRVEIEGIADLILKTHDGDWLLFDYKTGRFNPGKYFLQLAVYRYMFNKILGVFPRKTGIIFTNPSGHSPEIYFLDELTDFISIDVIGVFHRIAENYFS